MTQNFDAIIIGAGQAGPFLAVRLAQAGRKVALIERKFFGGTCVNTGCMPTKTMVASAYAAHVARRAADYGVVTNAPISIDMKRVQARAAKVTLDARTGLESWVKSVAGLHGDRRAGAIRIGQHGPSRRAGAHGAEYFHQRRRARERAEHAGREHGSVSDQHDDIEPRRRAQAPGRSSAAATSGSNSRRCSVASARK